MDLFASMPAVPDASIGVEAGRTGLLYYFDLLYKEAWVQLHFYLEPSTNNANRTLFEALKGQQKEIELDFGGSLEFEYKNNVEARIVKRFKHSILSYPDDWTKYQDDMIDAMIKLDQVLQPRIATYFEALDS